MNKKLSRLLCGSILCLCLLPSIIFANEAKVTQNQTTINASKVTQSKSSVIKTTTNVNLRNGPSAKKPIILMIPKGRMVQVLGESGTWSKVSYNQKIGYISSQYIKINKNTPSNNLLPSKKYEVIANSLNVRSAALTNSSILGTLVKGTKIDVMNISNNWAKIKYKNKDAYVNATYLKVVNTSNNSDKNTPSNNLLPSKKYEVIANSLNVRSAALTNSSILGALVKGTKIDVMNISNNWAKIKYKNKDAYVNVTYLKVVNTSNNSDKNTPSNNLPQSKKYEVTANSLNVTSSASANSSLLGTLIKGTKIDVINISNNWAKIKYNNKDAYVNATYLKMVNTSSNEETEIVENPKYSNIKIVLDAGHGGNDSGAVGGLIKLKEKDLNLEMAQKVESKLKALGFNVIMTRTDDTYKTLSSRYTLANDDNANIFLSMHFNFADNTSANGIETLYKSDNILATYIQNELITFTGATNRGTKCRTDLAVLNGSKMPTALVELGFLSNELEESTISNASYRETISKGIVEGIIKYSEAYLVK